MTSTKRGIDAIDLLEDSIDEAPILRTEPSSDVEWHELFRIDRYDWDDPEWLAKTRKGKHAWRMIPLYMKPPGSYRGHPATMPSPYFAIVSPVDFKRLMHYPDGSIKRWTLKIDRDRENPDRILAMYARRSGSEVHLTNVLMHREVLRCIQASGTLGDHINGYGLDNRRCNLLKVRSSENQHNSRRERKETSKDYGLPPGVEKMSNGRFGGKLCKRKKSGKKGKDGRRPVVTIRSKLTWETPEPAHRWYQNRLKEMHSDRSDWAHSPKPRSFPLFPPLLEQEPSERSHKLRSKRRAISSDLEIPF